MIETQGENGSYQYSHNFSNPYPPRRHMNKEKKLWFQAT
jgi:hypothetical protein